MDTYCRDSRLYDVFKNVISQIPEGNRQIDIIKNSWINWTDVSRCDFVTNVIIRLWWWFLLKPKIKFIREKKDATEGFKREWFNDYKRVFLSLWLWIQWHGDWEIQKKVCVHMVKNLLDSRPVISIRFSKGCNKLRSNGDVSIGPTWDTFWIRFFQNAAAKKVRMQLDLVVNSATTKRNNDKSYYDKKCRT